jgi:hypothetical protein
MPTGLGIWQRPNPLFMPLVFLILPLTIFFAIFPGIVVLQMGFYTLNTQVASIASRRGCEHHYCQKS